jgi:hypothetical protein
MVSHVYSIRHDRSGIVCTDLGSLLRRLARFPEGSYLVYRSGGGLRRTSPGTEVCGLAVVHGLSLVEYSPVDPAPRGPSSPSPSPGSSPRDVRPSPRSIAASLLRLGRDVFHLGDPKPH